MIAQLSVASVTLRTLPARISRGSDLRREIAEIALTTNEGSKWATVEDLERCPPDVSIRLLADAERMARAAVAEEERLAREEQKTIERGPLVVRYGQDSTNVWWHAWVETVSGLGVGRTWRGLTIVAADEGGTLPHAWMARREAEAIAARINKIAPGMAQTER